MKYEIRQQSIIPRSNVTDKVKKSCKMRKFATQISYNYTCLKSIGDKVNHLCQHCDLSP